MIGDIEPRTKRPIVAPQSVIDGQNKEYVAKLFQEQQKAIDNQLAHFSEMILGMQQQQIAFEPLSVSTPDARLVPEQVPTLPGDESLKEKGRIDVVGEGRISVRYRNDGAGGVHRLEWIAASSAIDPATGLAWPNDKWTAVEGGDAEIYTP